jgi:nucleoside-diphosphate-sugar epimerase
MIILYSIKVRGHAGDVLKQSSGCGCGRLFGGHLVRRLKSEGFWVRGADIKKHKFAESAADEFMLDDLTDGNNTRATLTGIYEVYHLAADMGGDG